jgi:hypothetical protein
VGTAVKYKLVINQNTSRMLGLRRARCDGETD